MLQEEALLIAEKLGISGFTASNGSLQRFKQRYNLQKMATVGEDEDVSKEMLERASKRDHTRMESTECVEHGWNRTFFGEIYLSGTKAGLTEAHMGFFC